MTARFLGLGERVAVFRGPLGCTLAVDVTASELGSRALPAAAAPLSPTPWPPGEAGSRSTGGQPGIDRAALGAALDEAFAEPGPNPTHRTRAIVVVHGGEIVAERYAAGYGRESALAGWSMTKSAVNALVGVLVRDGKLALDAPLEVPEWSAPDDARRAITLRQLLHMSSGLRFSESYGNPLGDVLWMLFGTGDAARFAAGKRLASPPGRQWYYSSGTTNIIARALRRAVGDSEADYLAFPRRALFKPLGMASGVIEPDAAGSFVGSSFMFASARDWARLGLALPPGRGLGGVAHPARGLGRLHDDTRTRLSRRGVRRAFLATPAGLVRTVRGGGAAARRLPCGGPRGAAPHDHSLAQARGRAARPQRRPGRLGSRRVPPPPPRVGLTRRWGNGVLIRFEPVLISTTYATVQERS